MRSIIVLTAVALWSAAHGGAAAAASISQSAVNVGGAQAALLRPVKPRASIILMTGGDGYLSIASDGSIGRGAGNQLVRTREDYARRGFAVLVPDNGVDLAAAVAYMAKIKRPVTVAGTSRGTQRAARGIAAGARPDRLVLTSGFLSDASGDSDNVERILGSPSSLPPTLVVHNKLDQCQATLPAGVQPFIAWSAGRAHVTWLSGGVSRGRACGARAYHGFDGLDGRVVAVVAAFAGR
ncbi:MAG: alpha/beta hydrolase [Hyphomicrobiales bacterium]|nr:alpha/beta hydrolase [Hyphomicrobiales bacterium]